MPEIDDRLKALKKTQKEGRATARKSELIVFAHQKTSRAAVAYIQPPAALSLLAMRSQQTFLSN
jgi:hypothetical protein